VEVQKGAQGGAGGGVEGEAGGARAVLVGLAEYSDSETD
jgi:hypothetical protein